MVQNAFHVIAIVNQVTIELHHLLTTVYSLLSRAASPVRRRLGVFPFDS